MFYLDLQSALAEECRKVRLRPRGRWMQYIEMPCTALCSALSIPLIRGKKGHYIISLVISNTVCNAK